MKHGELDFSSEDEPRTLVVYGIIGNPETVVRSLEEIQLERPFALTNRYAIVSPDSPGLRLSSPGWIDLSLDQLASIESTEALFRVCRERIIKRSSPFSRLIRSFLDRYLDAATARLEAHSCDLGAKGTDDEIFDYRDWIFSAWLPLPQAQILLPAAFGGARPSFAELDVVFALAGRLIGVQIDGADTPLKSRREKIDYLVEHHPQLDLVRVPKSRLQDGAFIEDLFPEAVVDYWHGLSLPRGPCAPGVLLDWPPR